MNSSELALELSQRLNLSKTEVLERMNDMADIIKDELLKNNSITLGNLGVLETKQRNERVSVNPTSKKRLLIPPKLVVKFKMSSSLKEKIKKMKQP